MNRIAICIIIAAAVFWAAQDGRNVPARLVELAQEPRSHDGGPHAAQRGGGGGLTIITAGGAGGPDGASDSSGWYIESGGSGNRVYDNSFYQ